MFQIVRPDGQKPGGRGFEMECNLRLITEKRIHLV